MMTIHLVVQVNNKVSKMQMRRINSSKINESAVKIMRFRDTIGLLVQVFTLRHSSLLVNTSASTSSPF